MTGSLTYSRDFTVSRVSNKQANDRQEMVLTGRNNKEHVKDVCTVDNNLSTCYLSRMCVSALSFYIEFDFDNGHK